MSFVLFELKIFYPLKIKKNNKLITLNNFISIPTKFMPMEFRLFIMIFFS